MTDIVKYTCPNCGYYELKSREEKLKDVGLTFIVFCGLVAIILLTILIAAKGWFAPFQIAEYAVNNNLGLSNVVREKAINVTSGCTPGYQDCEAYQLYLYVSNFRYVEAPVFYSFDEIEKEHAGDCKNLARYLASLANNINIDAFVDCNNKAKHCITIMRVDGIKYLADPAQQKWQAIGEDYDYWTNIYGA